MERVELRWRDLLFIFSVQSFGFFDGLSTYVLAQKYSINYETSILIREIYLLLGPDGMLLAKLFIVIICLSITYILLHLNPCWKNMCTGIMTGVLLSGLLASTSNLLLITHGYSAYAYGFDVQQLCFIAIVAFPVLGIILDLAALYSYEPEIESHAEGEI